MQLPSFAAHSAVRTAAALVLPFITAGIQWLFWDAIRPFAWFLFFPTVFASAWLGSIRAGIIATVFSALLAKFFFMPPFFSFAITDAMQLINLAMFIMMGTLFSFFNERMRQANRKTMAALDETKAANEKITQLYQKNLELDELKSQFFANVSHELRTPLTLILGPVGRLLQELPPDDPARTQLAMIERNARLLYRHVCDLLDLAKLESGRMSIHCARLELAELTRGIASHFDSVARERNIDYRVETPKNLPFAVDGEKVQRILLNLLSNAFNFTPDNGRIVICLTVDDHSAVIEVRDNGPGVPEELRDAVFERFRQIDGGVQRRQGGTGLGLAIVKEFAELHGGSACVAEAPEGGALFTVRLPVAEHADAVAADTATRVDPVITQETVEAVHRLPTGSSRQDTAIESAAPLVLVVEDNPDMRDFIVEALRPHYRAMHAADGRAGLEKARELRPDLILCDVMMPGMSGDEMALELRRNPDMQDLPIIMLTAKADDALRVRLLKAGVQGYINKPFSVEELLARAAGLIGDRRRSNAQIRESEDKYRLLAENSPDLIFWKGADQRYRYVAPACLELTGHTPEEFLQDPELMIKVLHPDDQPLFREHIRRDSEPDYGELDLRLLDKTGRVRWVSHHCRPIYGANGEFLGRHGSNREITERKQAEERLRQHIAELERFNRASVGREVEMIKLKHQVNDLARQLGRPQPYDLAFARELQTASENEP